MTITHHPEPESLMSCSAGSMPEAFAAVMASHIEMCPCCRKDLALLEQVGTALFDQLSPTPVVRPAPIVGLRADEAGPDRNDIVTASGDVPAHLVSTLGQHLDNVQWKRVSPGLWQHQIALSSANRGELRLIKVGPGQALPVHGHNGR